MSSTISKWFGTPSVAVDAVIFTIKDSKLQILLIKRQNTPFKGDWALPGGFLWKDELLETGAGRILKDKAGVKEVFVEQLYAFDSRARDPRGHVISISYYALAPLSKIKPKHLTGTQTPTFFPISELPKLAFDHKTIINYARKRLGYKLAYTNVVYSLLPPTFTFSDLQMAYEIILAEELDKRNFRKKFMSLGLIKKTRQKRAGSHRPAELFEFKSRKPAELKRFF